MTKKKTGVKALAKQKSNRRKLLSFLRICRYGLDSFVRNSWLSVAATAVMAITLLIVFTTFVAQNVLTDTVGDLRNKVDMSIYLKTETTNEEADSLMAELDKLSSVRSVTYVSAEEGREKFIEENKTDNDMIESLKTATNMIPGTLRVIVDDINDTSQLQDFVNDNELLKEHISPDHEPSFAGERRETIENIGRAVNFAQQVGVIAGSVFMAISVLIIFNTIRMAIFNRKEEIQMMKLIGADQLFIRGPFLVESIIYGFIAALIATVLGFFGLYKSFDTLVSYEISVQPTIDLINDYSVFIMLIMVFIGAIIGIVSSLLATHKYLKL